MKSTFLIFFTLFTAGITLIIVSTVSKPTHVQEKVNPENLPEISTTYTLKLSEDLQKQPLPTNKWFTGSLGEKDNPIYPYPYSIELSAKKISYSVPSQVKSEQGVFQSFTPEIIIEFDKDYKYELEYFDTLVARYKFYNDAEFFKLTLVRGNPLIYISECKNSFILKQAENFTEENLVISNSGNLFYLESSGSVSAVDLNSLSGNYITLGYIPNERYKESYKKTAANLPVKSEVNFTFKDSNKLHLDYKIFTENDGDTFVGFLPIHKKFLEKTVDTVFSTNTIRGNLETFIGKEFRLSIDLIVPAKSLDNKSSLLTELDALMEIDLRKLSIQSSTIYFTGKELFRLANMLEPAILLDKTDNGKRVRLISGVLKTELIDWFTYTEGEGNKFFAYDTKAKGILAQKPEFGSEQYNDHHFHYGYFIYAYSKLGEIDSEFKENYAKLVTELVLDIMNYNKENNRYPFLRYFDLFEWHSWANGLEQFRDGNNQESVSEAINAWYSVFLNSQIQNNLEMRNYSLALYTMESEAANEYWWNFNNILPNNIPFISLLWQGKAELATFFSNEIEAKLGIIILPISKGSMYLRDSPNAFAKYQYFKNNASGSGFLEDQIYFWAAINRLVDISFEGVKALKLDSSNSYSYMYMLLSEFNDNK